MLLFLRTECKAFNFIVPTPCLSTILSSPTGESQLLHLTLALADLSLAPSLSSSTTWHLQKWARPQDAMLVASVQVRRIQSTYRDLITGVSSGPSRQGGSSTSATAGSSSASYESRRVMLDTIVPALQRELEGLSLHPVQDVRVLIWS